MDIVIRKSPLAPLYQRGVIPPFAKGRSGGILQINVFTIMRLLIMAPNSELITLINYFNLRLIPAPFSAGLASLA
jgi:hypothetical protein